MENKLIALPLLAASFSPATPTAQEISNNDKQPNIIIIYCDDMGYGDLGVTGHPDIKTPNIDRMAVDGLRFTNYYSCSPASTASRYSLLTGRYPSRSGFNWVLNPDDERGIHPEEVTLAEALKEQGYSTAIYGKWHLGSTRKEYLPLQNGFDDYTGLPYSNDMIPPLFPEIALMNGNDTIRMMPDQSELTELYTEKAIGFLRKNKDNKFFVYLPYAMPHVPLYPGKAFAGKSLRGTYSDVIEEIDWGVGRILDALQEEGLAENTIVWFMSDNGPWVIKNEEGGSAGLFRDGKGSTWEGGMRVPCIVSWPGTAANGINENTINAMDIYATCISLAGGEIPSTHLVDGIDVSPYLTGYKQDLKNDEPFYFYGLNNELMAVRKGPWKLHIKQYSQLGIQYFNGKVPLLFNVHTDPSEKYDMSDKHPEIVRELTELIKTQNRSVKAAGNYWDN